MRLKWAAGFAVMGASLVAFRESTAAPSEVYADDSSYDRSRAGREGARPSLESIPVMLWGVNRDRMYVSRKDGLPIDLSGMPDLLRERTETLVIMTKMTQGRALELKGVAGGGRWRLLGLLRASGFEDVLLHPSNRPTDLPPGMSLLSEMVGLARLARHRAVGRTFADALGAYELEDPEVGDIRDSTGRLLFRPTFGPPRAVGVDGSRGAFPR